MSFRIARAVLALTVGLIDGLAVDASPGRSSLPVVRVDIIDEDDHTGIGHIHRERRVETVFGRHSMEPDGGLPGAHLAMHGLAVRSSMDTARRESEGLHQEVV